jgi:glycosyltransferase involved in cell wall biosynthesis
VPRRRWPPENGLPRVGCAPAFARLRDLRIALVHDWLTGYRGGERVLVHLARRHPDAALFTLFHVPGRVPAPIEALRIRTSALDALPFAHRHYRKLLPLMPAAIRGFDFRGYDLILSTSHAFAKSIRRPAGVPHLDYCFTPMRYVWDREEDYLGRGLKRAVAAPLAASLRAFDRRTAGPDSVTRFVAISREVAGRIRRHYGREANVVPPPVDLDWIERASGPADDFFLLVGGFVPYKREDLVLEAFRRSGRRLVVAGDGPGRRALERCAPPNVEFTGRVDERTLAELYRRCRALIHPQHEDFGLVAVEVQAAGRPVIAFGAGGVLDSVVPLPGPDPGTADRGALDGDRSGDASADGTGPTPTGVFFDRQTPEALEDAIRRFEKAEFAFHPVALRCAAERFAPHHFDAALDRELAALDPTLAPARAGCDRARGGAVG